MNERYKIGEARFFLARMEESVEDRGSFRYYLSAFLSAARTVLQYALEESERKNSRQWYDDTVGKFKLMKDFFKDKRDANIHREEPIDPSRHVTIANSEGVGVISAASEVFFNDKPVKMERPAEEPPPLKPPERRHEDTVRYRFNDWSSPEDVIGLSHRYIDELESFIQSGMKIGILTG